MSDTRIDCGNCVRNGCAGQCERAGEMWDAGSSEAANSFQETTCSRCAKDAAANGTVNLYDSDGADLCDIIGAACFAPVPEWIHHADGRIVCTQFQPKDEPGLPRCPHTLELPL